jgi:hypothetical protein
MSKLSDQRFQIVEASCNHAIHEIVFACQHAEDDDPDQALDCLSTAQATLEQVASELGVLEKAGISAPVSGRERSVGSLNQGRTLPEGRVNAVVSDRVSPPKPGRKLAH